MEIIVNGETIPSMAFEHELNSFRQQNPNASEEDAKKLTQQRVIEWAIIRQEAKKADIAVWSGEVDNQFEKMCQAHGGKEAFFQRFNMSDADEGRIKSDIEQDLKTQRFLDMLSKDIPEPNDEIIAQFYSENKERFIHPERIHAMHIVKQPKNDQEASKAEQVLCETRQQLLDGADFIELAAKASESAEIKTDLGFVAKGEIPPAMQFILFSMNVGEISPVFQSQFGLHIATVLDKKPAAQRELDECRDEIRGGLLQGAKNEAIGKWVAERKEKAEIEIKEA